MIHSQIRTYDPADLTDIKFMAEEIVEDGTHFPFEHIDGVLDYWFSKGSQVYIAESEDGVVGSYVIKPNLPGRCSHIANAGYMVKKKCRGQGIGRALAVHSLDIASQLGYAAMQFNIVVATNLSAVELWKGIGFETIGIIPRAFRFDDGRLVDVLIMHRTL